MHRESASRRHAAGAAIGTRAARATYLLAFHSAWRTVRAIRNVAASQAQAQVRVLRKRRQDHHRSGWNGAHCSRCRLRARGWGCRRHSSGGGVAAARSVLHRVASLLAARDSQRETKLHFAVARAHRR
jgi:hypothetical protein